MPVQYVLSIAVLMFGSDNVIISHKTRPKLNMSALLVIAVLIDSLPFNTSGADQMGVPMYAALQFLVLRKVPSNFRGKLTPKSQSFTISKLSAWKVNEKKKKITETT